MGPFILADLLGLDTVLHVARHLNAAYGDSFYVHEGMARLVEAGELGAKTGKGFYGDGAPRTEGATDVDPEDLAERFMLKALVEACLVLEEGVGHYPGDRPGHDGRRGAGSTALRPRGTPPAWMRC